MGSLSYETRKVSSKTHQNLFHLVPISLGRMLIFSLLVRSCTSWNENKSILNKGHSPYIVYNVLSKFPQCFNLITLGKK